MAARRSRVASYGWIERQGLVLLTKIAPGYGGAGHWTLPGGGLHWGEHPEDTLRREVHEEAGLRGEVGELLGVDSTNYSPSERNGFTAVHALRLIYRMTASGNPRVLEVDGSTSDAAWLPLANIDSLPTVELVAVGRKLAKGAGGDGAGPFSRR